MKNYLIGFTVALLVLAAVLAIGCTGIAPSAPPVVTGQGAITLSQQSTGIWVTGEGKVTVVPDVAVLTLGVETQATTVAEAQSQAATSMDAVMKELRRLGVAEKDIKTQQFNIFPVKRVEKDRELLIGYRVTNMVTAKIRSLVQESFPLDYKAGNIIDAVAKAGGDYTRINSISFTVDDPSAYLKQAREKAMKDAEAKAKQLADLSGVRLGKPTYINESGGYFPVIRGVMKEAIAGAPAPAPTTPITPGETEIQLNVQIVYSIM
ncbi:MAG: SIMPL domain-containing protein [Chloroflexota bacterium]